MKSLFICMKNFMAVILESSVIHGVVYNINNVYIKSIVFSYKNIVLSSSTTIVVSVLTLIVLLFMLINHEWLSQIMIYVQILFFY